ncbi:capsid protein [Astroviridae sp.]|nr:capsid protein [Astroviridae sp.]
MSAQKQVTETVKVQENNPKPQRQGRSRSRSRGRNRSRSRGRPVQKAPEGTIKTSVGGKTGTKETITVTSGDNSGARPRSNSLGRWRGRGGFRGRGRGRGGGNHLQREITALKKKTDGPKVAKTMTGTFTLGQIIGNDDTLLQQKYHLNLNPLLGKNTSTGQALPPLQDTAKDYALWKMQKCHIRLMPLVNSSNVSGTITVASLDQDAQAAKAIQIDDLLTRPYAEIQLGARYEWRIPSRKLEGPRQGWWVVNTNEEPETSIGPAVDIHCYGETFDLLNVDPTAGPKHYKGPLFIVQVVYTYAFANWEPKPGLGSLIAEEVGVQSATVQEDADGDLRVTVTETPSSQGKINRLTGSVDGFHLRHRNRFTTPLNAGESLGNTIWQIAAGAAESAAAVVPGPWGWLIKGGLWFLRRVFNRNGANAELQFKLYPSVDDASKNLGCQNAGITTPVTIKIEDDQARLNQLTCSNVNLNPVQSSVRGAPGPGPDAILPLGSTGFMHNPLLNDAGSLISDLNDSAGRLPSNRSLAFYMRFTTQNGEPNISPVLTDWPAAKTEMVLTLTTADGATWPSGSATQTVRVLKATVSATQQQKSFDAGPFYTKNTGTLSIGGLFGQGPNVNTGRGVLGDGYTLMNTLRDINNSQATDWGPFRKLKTATVSDGFSLPSWLTTGERWVCIVGVMDNCTWLCPNTSTAQVDWPPYGGGVFGYNITRNVLACWGVQLFHTETLTKNGGSFLTAFYTGGNALFGRSVTFFSEPDSEPDDLDDEEDQETGERPAGYSSDNTEDFEQVNSDDDLKPNQALMTPEEFNEQVRTATRLLERLTSGR